MKKCVSWMAKQILIQETFWVTLCFSISHPVIHQFLVSNISDRAIALESVAMSCAIVICNSCFNKWGKRIFKFMPWLLLAETAVYMTICPLIHFGLISPLTYYLIEVIAVAIITRNLTCCGNHIRRVIYAGEEREQYDNCNPIASSLAVIIGGSVAIVGVPLKVAWLVVMTGVVLDDIFLMVIWTRVRKMER